MSDFNATQLVSDLANLSLNSVENKAIPWVQLALNAINLLIHVGFVIHYKTRKGTKSMFKKDNKSYNVNKNDESVLETVQLTLPK